MLNRNEIKAEIAKLQDDIIRVEGVIGELELDQFGLEDELDALLHELSKLESQGEDADEDEIAELEDDAYGLEMEIGSIQDEIDALYSDIDEYQQAIDKMRVLLDSE